MSVKTLRDLLGARPLHSVTPETKLREVATVMATHKIGAVAVLDQERFVGILTERDIVFRGVGAGLVVDQACASDVMTVEPVTVDIDDAISDALAAKLGDAFRHLPVTENGIVVGVLSYRDIPAEYVMMFERFREMTTSRADEGA
ncbi:CBS domain-containing protein [Shimia litoralis]|uniref:CBS domain-containing protein n=1 Tax=Shimia litoralis TaxID=420403 RepID=A0A4U7N8B5_9RHOB|nr:CBS domain-containing protein [Shimia litoralis]TKZ22180.1 CBS domain-containing protein [Shimia litoralis]